MNIIVSICVQAIQGICSTFGLVVITIGLILAGGKMFEELEAPNEREHLSKIAKAEARGSLDFKTHLSDLSRQHYIDSTLTQEQYKKLVLDRVEELAQSVVTAIKDDGWTGERKTTEVNATEEAQALGWNQANSVLYAATVVTTIGYGHIAPMTSLGRLMTIVYALVGIPITLVTLAKIGRCMGIVFRCLYYNGNKTFWYLHKALCKPKKTKRKPENSNANADDPSSKKTEKDSVGEEEQGIIDKVVEWFYGRPGNPDGNVEDGSPNLRSVEDLDTVLFNSEDGALECTRALPVTQSTMPSIVDLTKLKQRRRSQGSGAASSESKLSFLPASSIIRPRGTGGPSERSRTSEPSGPPPTAGPSGPHPTAGRIWHSPIAGPKGLAPTGGPSGPSRPPPTAGPRGPHPIFGPRGPSLIARPSGPSTTAGPRGPSPTSGPSRPPPTAGPRGPHPTFGPRGPSPIAGPSGPSTTAGPRGPHPTSGPSRPPPTTGPRGPHPTFGPRGPSSIAGPSGPSTTAGPRGPSPTSGPSRPPPTAGPSDPHPTKKRPKQNGETYDKMAKYHKQARRFAREQDRYQIRVPVSLSAAVLAMYVVIGALIFQSVEDDWDFSIGCYFCFVTISTIGFGDFVFGTDYAVVKGDETWAELFQQQKKLIGTCTYIFLGLSLNSMCIDLMAFEVMQKIQRCGVCLGIVKAEDDSDSEGE